MIGAHLRKLSGWLQSATGSYKRHNAEYEASGKIEYERRAGLANLASDLINGPEIRAKDLLATHPEVMTAVDVGSGTGWSAAAMSPLVKTVFAIEPSVAATDIAKNLYPHDRYPNISWITGFAEDEIPHLKLSTPTLFLTGCVLSHIRDKEVIKICNAIDSVVPTGSVLSLAECWGNAPWHQLMWHVRTKDWWQEQFPGWKLTFHGPQVPNEEYHKGIWGVKEK